MRQAILTNKVTGEQHYCHATTDHPSSSYGQPVWADDEGTAYTQVDYPFPTLYEVEEVGEDLYSPEGLLKSLRETMQRKGVTIYQVAKATGTRHQVLGAALEAKNPTLKTILPALEYLGYKITPPEDDPEGE